MKTFPSDDAAVALRGALFAFNKQAAVEHNMAERADTRRTVGGGGATSPSMIAATVAASRSASPSPKASSCEGVDAASIASTGTLVSLFERGDGGANAAKRGVEVSPARSEGVSGAEARRMATERYMAAPPRMVARTQPPTPVEASRAWLPPARAPSPVSDAPSVATTATRTATSLSRRPGRRRLPTPPPRASSPANDENATPRPKSRLKKKSASTPHLNNQVVEPSLEATPKARRVPMLASAPVPLLEPVVKPPPKSQPSKPNVLAKPLKSQPSIPHTLTKPRLESRRLVKPLVLREAAAPKPSSRPPPSPSFHSLTASSSDDKLRHASKPKTTAKPSPSSLDQDTSRPRAIFDTESIGQPSRRSLDSHVPGHSLALALGPQSSFSVSPCPSPSRRLAFRRPANSSTGDLQLASLTNAIMAGSLASARLTPHNTGTSLPPPPPLPRRQKSPRLLSTLRNGSASDKEESRKTKRAHRHKLHANHAHHEGSRRRWRDEMTERERKRYEAVWASNRGSVLSRSNKDHGDGNDQDDDDDDDDAAVTMVLGPGREKSQCVVNVVVREVWKRSRLPDDELAEVWELVDRDKRGMLTRQEFVVGMWLIDQRLRGRKLPLRVSESVWASANGVTAKKSRFK
ncbi:hypothetical protein CDD81_1415 [Ophiocordyceps australis]|uniref:EH domain-containing protein n=1 Tax=Ophiocordyceps australis TaxID=1399860 RepID=A0A2C5XTM6_9HYPO|nr:hypothetical protein CDD81_1415 [Ophiocordyceps australis]